MTFHIRKRQRPRGGNQFYLDRSERKVETFCGAEPGLYDHGWNAPARDYVETTEDQASDYHGPARAPCEECGRLRDEYKATRKGKRS